MKATPGQASRDLQRGDLVLRPAQLAPHLRALLVALLELLRQVRDLPVPGLDVELCTRGGGSHSASGYETGRLAPMERRGIHGSQ